MPLPELPASERLAVAVSLSRGLAVGCCLRSAPFFQGRKVGAFLSLIGSVDS